MENSTCKHCGGSICRSDKICSTCNIPIFWIEVCENCKSSWREGDKYCRYCGAPMGTPIYIQDLMECIYGPRPVKRTHTCQKCGYEWQTVLMIDKEEFCPLCGHAAPVVRMEDA